MIQVILSIVFALTLLFYFYKTVETYIKFKNLYNENFIISLIFLFLLFQIGMHSQQTMPFHWIREFNETFIFYLMIHAGVYPILRYAKNNDKETFPKLSIIHACGTWIWIPINLLLLYFSWISQSNLWVWNNLSNFIYVTTIGSIFIGYMINKKKTEKEFTWKFIILSNILTLNIIVVLTELVDFIVFEKGNYKFLSVFWYVLIIPIIWVFLRTKFLQNSKYLKGDSNGAKKDKIKK